MGLFGTKKPNSFLGVDIGASGIKIVEFANKKGRATLLTYGYAELPKAELGDRLLEDPKVAGELLARLCKESGVKTTQVMTALPTSNVFSTILTIPNAKDTRSRQTAVNTEVAKLTPLPISEMILQTTFLDEDKKKDQKDQTEKKQTSEKKTDFRVLVTGAAKTFIQKYIELFKTAKLNLQAIDTEALALVRALVGKDKGAIMILDIGSKKTNIIIVEKGIPFVSRSVNVGGNTVTSQIMSQMRIDEQESERIKRDLGLSSQEAGGEFPKILLPIMQSLMNEIRYAFQLYANMELAQIKKVEKIIITGGSAHLPRLPEYLSEALNMNVYRGDPWARVVYPSDLSRVLEEIGPKMSVAVGLAMREMD